MKEAEAITFADHWIAAWNRRDVGAVVAHFADDVTFYSPRAQAVVGHNPVVGKEAMRSYWTQASAGISRLEFTLRDACYDGRKRLLSIHYLARIDEVLLQAVEVYRFDDGGVVTAGEAYYGSRL